VFSAGLQGDAAYGLRVGSPPHVRAAEGEGRTPFPSVVSSQFDFRLEKSMNYQDRLGAFRKEISLQKRGIDFRFRFRFITTHHQWERIR
jgi:hypothetical protein